MLSLPPQGRSKDTILQELERYKEKDLPWRTGRVLAYTYDPGPEVSEVAHEAYIAYLTENGLDPTTFPSMHRLETDIVHVLRDLVRGDEKVVGNCTTGGTESILCAVKASRDWARAHRPDIERPEMVLPATAHGAFHKGCVYLGIEPVVTPFDPVTFKADVAAMREAITDNTILLVGSAPGYAQGVTDPIPEIGALAVEKDLLFHVDACVGGIQLSLMRRMGGYEVPEFDFSVPGVTSMSADMHKYGYAPKNISTVLYRNKELRFYQIFTCRRTTTYALVNPTVLSTKSGGPLAAAWAVLQFLGESGYERIIREVMDATQRFVKGIGAIDGLRVLGEPDMCMFSFTSEGFNVFEVADVMRDKGWYVQPQFSTDLSPANLHITMDLAAVPHVEQVLADLREAVEEVKGAANPIDAEAVAAQVRNLLESLGEGAQEALMAMAGLEGAELPEKMALINTVMDALPDDMAEFILSDFINDLYA